jgi:hypothetical protein
VYLSSLAEAVKLYFIFQEGKKRFDKQTTKFCQSLERYLGLKTKAGESSLSEVSAEC